MLSLDDARCFRLGERIVEIPGDDFPGSLLAMPDGIKRLSGDGAVCGTDGCGRKIVIAESVMGGWQLFR